MLTLAAGLFGLWPKRTEILAGLARRANKQGLGHPGSGLVWSHSMSDRWLGLAGAVGAGLFAVWLGLSGAWIYALAVLVVVVWLGLSLFGFGWIKTEGKSLEKAGQSSLAAFFKIPVLMFAAGGVLAGGPYFGLPGQVLMALSGDRTALLVIAGKGSLTVPGVAGIYWVIAKGSRL